MEEILNSIKELQINQDLILQQLNIPSKIYW